MCGMQALGNAYEDTFQERHAPAGPMSPKSGKRKAADSLFGTAPAKRRVLSQPSPVGCQHPCRARREVQAYAFIQHMLHELNQAQEVNPTNKAVSIIVTVNASNGVPDPRIS
jgi:hypothetical protein